MGGWFCFFFSFVKWMRKTSIWDQGSELESTSQQCTPFKATCCPWVKSCLIAQNVQSSKCLCSITAGNEPRAGVNLLLGIIPATKTCSVLVLNSGCVPWLWLLQGCQPLDLHCSAVSRSFRSSLAAGSSRAISTGRNRKWEIPLIFRLKLQDFQYHVPIMYI